jgi:hypothetical protein
MRLLTPDEVCERLGLRDLPVPPMSASDVDDLIAGGLILAGIAVGYLLRWVLP